MAEPDPKKNRNVYRKPLLVLAVASCLLAALVIYRIQHPGTPATVQEIEAREAASLKYAAQKEAAQKAKRDRNVALCQQKALCVEFGSARQECATAGDFNNCMIVKMGNIDWSLIAYCTNDGSVVDPPSDLPGDLICFGYAHGL